MEDGHERTGTHRRRPRRHRGPAGGRPRGRGEARARERERPVQRVPACALKMSIWTPQIRSCTLKISICTLKISICTGDRRVCAAARRARHRRVRHAGPRAVVVRGLPRALPLLHVPHAALVDARRGAERVALALVRKARAKLAHKRAGAPRQASLLGRVQSIAERRVEPRPQLGDRAKGHALRIGAGRDCDEQAGLRIRWRAAPDQRRPRCDRGRFDVDVDVAGVALRVWRRRDE